MPAKVSVEVYKLDGECITLKLDRQTSTLLLKHKLAELWNIPPECQKLLYGDELLDNHRCVTSLPKSMGSKISVMYITSHEAVFACLDDESLPLARRQNALRAVADMAHRDLDRALSILETNLQDTDIRVREVALQGLLQVSLAGDEATTVSVLQIARNGLHHPEEVVRATCAELLGSAAAKGDRKVLGILRKHVSDRSAGVRQSVAWALSSVAYVGDLRAMTALLMLSSDDMWVVKEAAARALGETCLSHDIDGISALIRLAKDDHRNVRIVAAKALSNMHDRQR